MACLSTATHAAHEAASIETRPNIILFLVDDLGQQDVSVPMLETRSALNNRFHTPNLERLAARGVRFSNAYAAAAVCTPSRCSILTGQSPARLHITYWTLEKDSDTTARHPRLDAPLWQVNGLQPTGSELPQVLHDAGYHTIHAGKAHFGARSTAGADPCAFGFDINIAGHAAGAPGSYLGVHHFKDLGRKQAGKSAPDAVEASVWDVPGLAQWHGKNVWLDDVLAREACAAIEKSVRDAKPFYLSFCPYGVHAPIMEDARFAADFPDLDATERAYATMVAAVDEALGQLVAQCEHLGVLDNTIIIFTSDNGGLSAHARGAAPDGSRAHHHNAPLASGKGSAYEGGLRVPLVIAGTGIAHRGTPIAWPVIGTDLYPTILALAGVALPPARICDGVDLRSYFNGNGEKEEPPSERTLLFHQPHAWGPEGPGIEPFSAVRQGDWKLIFFHDAASGHPQFALFDVANDFAEANNRATTDPERLAQLKTIMRAKLTETNAQMPRVRVTNAAVSLP